MVSDCLDFTEMGHFARAQLDWLRQFTPLCHGPPSHNVCGEKSHELDALPRLLSRLQLHGATVSIDAMGGHTDITKLIVEQGGDNLLALKCNEKEAQQTLALRHGPRLPHRNRPPHFPRFWGASPDFPCIRCLTW